MPIKHVLPILLLLVTLPAAYIAPLPAEIDTIDRSYMDVSPNAAEEQ